MINIYNNNNNIPILIVLIQNCFIFILLEQITAGSCMVFFFTPDEIINIENLRNDNVRFIFIQSMNLQS